MVTADSNKKNPLLEPSLNISDVRGALAADKTNLAQILNCKKKMLNRRPLRGLKTLIAFRG
jgi:hypothetical protein